MSALGIFISRLLGLARDLLLAATIGFHADLGSFFLAYRCAYLFRRLLGEGAVQNAFIPSFIGEQAKGPSEGTTFYLNLRKAIFCIASALILVGWFFAVLTIHWWGEDPSTQLVAKLTIIMLPGLPFIVLSSLQNSFLNCHGLFFLPSVSSCCLNIAWITAIFLARGSDGESAALLMAVGVTIGSFLQWLLLIPQARKLYVEGRTSSPFEPWRELVHFLKPLTYALVTIFVVQCNTACDAICAYTVDPRGPTYLWYAIRIQQLPLSLFAIALSSALFPKFSQAVVRNDPRGVHLLLRKGVSKSIALLLPVTIATLFILYGVYEERLLDGFFVDEEGVAETIRSLAGYFIGLIPMGVSIMLNGRLCSGGHYRKITFATLATVGLNLLLNGWILTWERPFPCAFACTTAFSSWVYLVLQLTLIMEFSCKEMIQDLTPMVVSTLVALGVLWPLYQLMTSLMVTVMVKLILLLTASFVFLLIYLITLLYLYRERMERGAVAA